MNMTYLEIVNLVLYTEIINIDIYVYDLKGQVIGYGKLSKKNGSVVFDLIKTGTFELIG